MARWLLLVINGIIYVTRVLAPAGRGLIVSVRPRV